MAYTEYRQANQRMHELAGKQRTLGEIREFQQLLQAVKEYEGAMCLMQTGPEPQTRFKWPTILLCNLVAFSLVGTAGYMAIHDIWGWGWFLVFGFLTTSGSFMAGDSD